MKLSQVVLLLVFLLAPSYAQWPANFTEEAICENGNQTALIISAVSVIVIGAVFVFAGHKIIKGLAFIVGFAAGFAVCYIIIERYISQTLAFGWKIGISAGVGLILGGLAAFLLILATALLGFSLGAFVASIFLATPLGPSLFSAAEWAPLVTIGLSGLAGLVVALVLKTYVLILASAVTGAVLMAFAVDCAWLHTHLIQVIPRIIEMQPLPAFTEGSSTMYYLLGGAGGVALIGSIVQLVWYLRPSRQHPSDDEALQPLI